MTYYVYILASRRHGTPYVGVTNDLVRRVYEHKEGFVDGFTKKYGVTDLVHFEQYDQIAQARQREKNLKQWRRDWKVELIERDNPEWTDLYDLVAAPISADRPLP